MGSRKIQILMTMVILVWGCRTQLESERPGSEVMSVENMNTETGANKTVLALPDDLRDRKSSRSLKENIAGATKAGGLFSLMMAKLASKPISRKPRNPHFALKCEGDRSLARDHLFVNFTLATSKNKTWEYGPFLVDCRGGIEVSLAPSVRNENFQLSYSLLAQFAQNSQIYTGKVAGLQNMPSSLPLQVKNSSLALSGASDSCDYDGYEKVKTIRFDPKSYLSQVKDFQLEEGASYYFKAKVEGSEDWTDSGIKADFFGWLESKWMANLYAFFRIHRVASQPFYAFLGCSQTKTLWGQEGYNMANCQQVCQKFEGGKAKKNLYFLLNDASTKNILGIDIYGNNTGMAEVSLFKKSD